MEFRYSEGGEEEDSVPVVEVDLGCHCLEESAKANPVYF